MCDPILQSEIDRALFRFNSELEGDFPYLGKRLFAWMSHLSPNGSPCDHFTNSLMFPFLQLPRWLANTLSNNQDQRFHLALTSSSIYGYYCIRLLDNAMDGDGMEYLDLLPAAIVFINKVQASYQRYFSEHHPFWDHWRQSWLLSTEATVRDATLKEVTGGGFRKISSRKYVAAHIPIIATCYYYGSPKKISTWLKFCESFSCWSQMLDDLRDWHEDRCKHRPSYLLSQATRCRYDDESLDTWMIREGFRWGMDKLHQWMLESISRARSLQSPPLLSYLRGRENQVNSLKKQVLKASGQLSEIDTLLRKSCASNFQDLSTATMKTKEVVL